MALTLWWHDTDEKHSKPIAQLIHQAAEEILNLDDVVLITSKLEEIIVDSIGILSLIDEEKTLDRNSKFIAGQVIKNELLTLAADIKKIVKHVEKKIDLNPNHDDPNDAYYSLRQACEHLEPFPKVMWLLATMYDDIPDSEIDALPQGLSMEIFNRYIDGEIEINDNEEEI